MERPAGQSGWSYEWTYHKGTPDETRFRISVASTSTDYDKGECRDKMWAVINNCDGNDPNNPMTWKFGGEYVHGDYTYEVSPKKSNRHWPVPKEAGGDCKGWYHGYWSSYVMHGYGWADHDFGQKTLMAEARDCVGGELSMWKFKYFDQPDKNGNEWQADFNTPIWVRQRCFNNNKAQLDAGGFTHGCGGND